MNNTLGVFEAKAHLSEIIDNVENGKEYIITRHGKPVARITGARESVRQTIRETIDALMDFRKDHKATHAEIHEWVKEGRRF